VETLIWRRQPVRAGSFEDEITGLNVQWQPALDIYETQDQFLLVFSLPGVRAEDLEVMVADGRLVVSGRRLLPLPPGVRAHLIESPRGYFERRVRLPGNSDLAALGTELADGQLLVRVPKVSRPAVQIRVTRL
jgi:HSP20 family molecular chaperone IbpA